MRTFELPSGHHMPALGLGTWRMGERSDRRPDEVAAIRAAIEYGVRLIDTAEMYGEGGAEKVIGSAMHGQREQLFLVSKVYPHNASYDGVLAACERSLRRLNSDYIDLYLLHWPGSYPLEETFDAFQSLKDSGKIRDFGVSNFDIDDLEAIPAEYRTGVASNQVFYNLAHRETEWAVSPWCGKNNIPVMAYSPLDQAGRLLQSAALNKIAEQHSATVAQIALAWLLHQDSTVVIPKSAHIDRIKENMAALEITLSEDDLHDINAAFPAPAGPVRLGMR